MIRKGYKNGNGGVAGGKKEQSGREGKKRGSEWEDGKGRKGK